MYSSVASEIRVWHVEAFAALFVRDLFRFKQLPLLVQATVACEPLDDRAGCGACASHLQALAGGLANDRVWETIRQNKGDNGLVATSTS